MRACVLGLLLAALGCSGPFRSDSRWLRIAHDTLYDIALDTTRVTSSSYHTYIVRYRTDHAVPHMYKGEEFNREIVVSYLRCGDLAFKVAAVDMSMRGHGTVIQQRSEGSDLVQQPWRHVQPGTIEATAARRTCDFARAHETEIAERSAR
jgi:hypothetical protein